MKPIVPTQILGGSILIEQRPLSTGAATVHRGVDLGLGVAEISSLPRQGAGPSGPYRGRPTDALAPSPVPVVVRSLHLVDSDVEASHLFAESTRRRRHLASATSPVPRLLYVFGREDRCMASVEEYVAGTTMETLMSRLRTASIQMPVPIALAVTQGMVSLWLAATSSNLHVSVTPRGLRLDGPGRVRVIPSYPEERARQAVGAAILVLPDIVAYVSPEQIQGIEPDARSAMFNLGMLLYELIAGVHPLSSGSKSMFEVLSEMQQRDVPRLREHRSGVHPAVSELVHRCLARDPDRRFASWPELAAALAGVQALFPPTGAAEIAAWLRGAVPGHPTDGMPPVDLPEDWQSLRSLGYHALPPPRLPSWSNPLPTGGPRALPALDPDAVYTGMDARPMYRTTPGLLIDARPVTRAEMGRFFLVTRTPLPPHLSDVGSATGEGACTYVPADLAEAYARWAGKRLPTEAEWEAAVAALGPERLGVGAVWEWTSTPHDSGGRVVCGGRWRDQPGMPPSPDNRSFATRAAPDLGFRCVAPAAGEAAPRA